MNLCDRMMDQLERLMASESHDGESDFDHQKKICLAIADILRLMVSN